MKKVLLINPPFARIAGLEQDYIPMSLWHISTLLKQQGFDPYIKNLNITDGLHYVSYLDRVSKYATLMSLYNEQKHHIYAELDAVIKEVKPDMIGMTVLTPQIKIVNDLIDYITTNYRLPIFVGGAGASLNSAKIAGSNMIFKGGINNFTILHHLNKNNDYFNKQINDAELNLFDYNGILNFDNILDKYSNNAYGHVFSSIGCYANCRFCSSPAIWKRKVHFKSIDSFCKELYQIAVTKHPDSFHIWDENFTTKSPRLFEFSRKYNLNIPWECDSRIDTLDERKVSLMKEHGCFQVAVGAESGSQKILDYLNKGIDKSRIKRTIDMLNKFELKSKIYMIMGFPGETYSDMQESVDFIMSCKPTQITLSLFTPYLHTSLYAECLQSGLIDDSYDESEHSHQSGTFLKKISPEINIENIIKTIDKYNKL